MFTITVGSATMSAEGCCSMNLNDYMSVEEAGKLWGLTPGWIRVLCRNQEIKSMQFRNMWLIEKDQPNPKKKEVEK